MGLRMEMSGVAAMMMTWTLLMQYLVAVRLVSVMNRMTVLMMPLQLTLAAREMSTIRTRWTVLNRRGMVRVQL